jgi:hypothetical protein
VTDRLTLTRAFEGAGLKSGDAERIATEIYEAIHDNVATKTDIAALRTEVKTDIAALRTEVKTDIAALRTEVKTDTAALRTELRELELRLTLRLGAAIAVVAGLLFTALHYWPPHG